MDWVLTEERYVPGPFIGCSFTLNLGKDHDRPRRCRESNQDRVPNNEDEMTCALSNDCGTQACLCS